MVHNVYIVADEGSQVRNVTVRGKRVEIGPQRASWPVVAGRLAVYLGMLAFCAACWYGVFALIRAAFV